MSFRLSAMTRPKRVAKLLREQLSLHDVQISLPKSQSLTAKMYGYGTWYQMQQSTIATSGDETPLDDAVSADERDQRLATYIDVLVQQLGIAGPDARSIVMAIAPSGRHSEGPRPGGPMPRREPIELPDYVRIPPGELSEGDAILLQAYDDGSTRQPPGHLVLIGLGRKPKNADQDNSLHAHGYDARALHESARRGLPLAMYNLGMEFARADNPFRHEATARFWYETAISTLDSMTAHRLHYHSKESAKELKRMAKANLGNLYQYAEDLPRDLGKALELYREAAREGEPVAQFNCALMLMHGWGCEADLVQALPYLEQAAKGGCPPAMSMFGEFVRAMQQNDPRHMEFFWANIIGGTEEWARIHIIEEVTDPEGPYFDVESAIELAVRCLPEDMPEAASIAAQALLRMPNPKARQAALKINASLADRGNLVSLVNLAIAYLTGDQVRKDAKKARSLLESAVAIDPSEVDPEDLVILGRAHCLLGEIMMGEDGQPADMAASVAYFRKALDLGDAEAGVNLGVALEQGRNGPPDNDAAAKAYNRAAMLGSVAAKTNLGILHALSRFSHAKPSFGLELLQEAAKAGDDVARRALALIEDDAFEDRADRP